MSREVRRVPLDFDFPLNETWRGYLMPESLTEEPCGQCDAGGWSPFAEHMQARWYGRVPFDPSETGSALLTPETLEVRAFAERNVAHAGWFLGSDEAAIRREAVRLCALWNGRWSHHLHQDDVDVLIARGRLRDFTHRFVKGQGWVPVEPAPTVSADEVNRWSLRGFGHDASNCWVVVRAACERAGEPDLCERCDGHGGVERYPGQRAEAEAWERVDPPTGVGYQLWQTVSEGGPVSPVFPTPGELADWIGAHGSEFDGRDTPREALVRWIASGGSSVGSFAVVPGRGLVSGVALAAGGGS